MKPASSRRWENWGNYVIADLRKMTMHKILSVAAPLALTCLACGSKHNSDGGSMREFKFSCLSKNQEYGNYNDEMHYVKVKNREKNDFAITIDKGVIKLFNISYEKMWIQDTISLDHEENGVYLFQSILPEKATPLGELQLPYRYMLDIKNNRMYHIGRYVHFSDDGKSSYVEWTAAVFKLNCN